MPGKKRVILVALLLILLLGLGFVINLFCGARVVKRKEINYLGSSIKEDEEKFEWGLSDLFQTSYKAQWELSKEQWSVLQRKMSEDGWDKRTEKGEVQYQRLNRVRFFFVNYYCSEEISVREKEDTVILRISIIVDNQFAKQRQR